MLRPATPLTVVLFCAFVLLLISSLSAPVIKGVPLARWETYNFGVFGYCAADGKCTRPEVGYTTDNLFGDRTKNPNFNLSVSARHSLSSLLIVHPVAAFMTLIMLVLAAASHFHSPSHSPRYLLGLLILTLPTLLITLLAFLVDILLFIPHVAWGGWICLAATILIVISGICLCAMRRTLVSRKARRKRIQENAEMSGENFYTRQRDQEAKFAAVTPVSESRAPLVNGAPGADLLPAHATYAEFHADQAQQSNHEPVSPDSDQNRFYGSQYSGPTLNNSSPAAPPKQISVSQGQIPDGNYPPQSYGQARGGAGHRGRGAPRPYGRGGPRGGGPYRGPAGFQGRGSYGPDSRGGYRGRGGPMMPPGAPGAMVGRRPPPGYPPPQSGPYAAQYGQYSNGNSQPTSPSGYGQPGQPGDFQQGYGAPRGVQAGETGGDYDRRRSFDGTESLARAETPPEMEHIGQAVGTDTTSGYVDIAIHSTRSHEDHRQIGAPTTEQYAPARSEWNQPRSHSENRPRGTSIVSQGSSHYYEDVPNKFATEDHPTVPQHNEAIQTNLSTQPQHGAQDLDPLPQVPSLEDIRPGARSPTASEQSAWTSVSQRPVNPDWLPGHGGEFHQFGPPKRPNQTQARRDILLASNPDFSVPTMGSARGPGRSRGGHMGNVGGVMPPPAMDLSGDGRYPEPTVLSTREI